MERSAYSCAALALDAAEIAREGERASLEKQRRDDVGDACNGSRHLEPGVYDRSDARFNPDGSLRTEIGDTEYEQYLAATGRSTSVAIGSVIESSPGQRAGLLAGDEILRYDGTRIFSTRELVEHTMQGDPGQSIVVDIVRDGVPMQFVLPRGPIGVSTARGRWRR